MRAKTTLGSAALAALLFARTLHAAPLALSAHVLEGQTHNSIFPRALSNGLRFVFEGR